MNVARQSHPDLVTNIRSKYIKKTFDCPKINEMKYFYEQKMFSFQKNIFISKLLPTLALLSILPYKNAKQTINVKT